MSLATELFSVSSQSVPKDVSTQTTSLLKFPWVVDTKYYTAELEILLEPESPVSDKHLTDETFARTIDAIIVMVDKSKVSGGAKTKN
jgi:hypothetical protein